MTHHTSAATSDANSPRWETRLLALVVAVVGLGAACLTAVGTTSVALHAGWPGSIAWLFAAALDAGAVGFAVLLARRLRAGVGYLPEAIGTIAAASLSIACQLQHSVGGAPGPVLRGALAASAPVLLLLIGDSALRLARLPRELEARAAADEIAERQRAEESAEHIEALVQAGVDAEIERREREAEVARLAERERRASRTAGKPSAHTPELAPSQSPSTSAADERPPRLVSALPVAQVDIAAVIAELLTAKPDADSTDLMAAVAERGGSIGQSTARRKLSDARKLQPLATSTVS